MGNNYYISYALSNIFRGTDYRIYVLNYVYRWSTLFSNIFISAINEYQDVNEHRPLECLCDVCNFLLAREASEYSEYTFQLLCKNCYTARSISVSCKLNDHVVLGGVVTNYLFANAYWSDVGSFQQQREADHSLLSRVEVSNVNDFYALCGSSWQGTHETGITFPLASTEMDSVPLWHESPEWETDVSMLCH
jgi:hypothetical protein